MGLPYLSNVTNLMGASENLRPGYNIPEAVFEEDSTWLKIKVVAK